MYLKGTDQYPFPSEPSVKGLSITQVDSEDMSVETACISPSCQTATEARYKTYPLIGQKVWQGNIQLSIPIHHLVCPFDTSLFPFHLVISQCTCTCQLIAAAQSHVDDVLFVWVFILFKVRFISATRVNATSFV